MNIRRRTLVFGILLMSVFIMPWVAQGQQTDVEGWGKVTWGMTMAEVKKAYPEAYPVNLPDKTVKLQTQGPVISGYPFLVNFSFDSAGRLTKIGLRLSDDNQATDTTFQTLEKRLISKYGMPAKKDQNTGPTGSIHSVVTWICPSTIIELHLMNVMDKIKILTILYNQVSTHGL